MDNMLKTFCIIFLLFNKVLSLDKCEEHESCRSCIQENIECVWCTAPKVNSSNCKSKLIAYEDWCTVPHLDPQKSYSQDRREPFSSDKGHVIQLQPQLITLSLRKNEAYTFRFRYKQAENYPVDLYYLMDLSASMKRHKFALGSLGQSISETMRSLTNNFRLGFGSFVDKPTLPFVAPKKYLSYGPIAKPYSFKNHLSLQEDYSEFNFRVTNAKLSENIDSPEGGLDALMQAMVCKKEIGWRSQARHLLVYSSDAGFHISGDGKLGGVVEPNDAKCHLTNDEYTDSLIYDYPSISHVNQVAQQNNINIVFAVSGQKINNTYHRLSEKIENSNVGTLSQNSENVVELIRENYNKIVDSVTMTTNATSDVEIKFENDCSQKDKKPNGCNNVHVGTIINFYATVRPTECSEKNSKIIAIKPVGLDEEIILNLNVICDCDCEKKSDVTFEEKSDKCENHGDFACGVCECEKGRYGDNCECDGDSLTSQDVRECQIDGNSTVCSGRGECKCNKCVCDDAQTGNPDHLIYGKYCECDNFNCNRGHNKLCSGNGKCECNQCKCDDGWIGESCECRSKNTTCIAPGDDKLCSGHGTCSCGQCFCDVDEKRYSGMFCEDCATCPSQRCEEIRPCVECNIIDNEHKTSCPPNCTLYEINTVTSLNSTINSDVDYKKCQSLDKDGCRIIFRYYYSEYGTIIVDALDKRICTEVDIIAWVSGVVGSILLAGLLMLIIWKICTDVHDRKEYAKFEKERENIKWHANKNPLYVEATTEFNNPVFNKNVIVDEKEDKMPE